MIPYDAAICVLIASVVGLFSLLLEGLAYLRSRGRGRRINRAYRSRRLGRH